MLNILISKSIVKSREAGMKKFFLLTIFVLSVFAACVPARKFEDAQAMIEKLNAENKNCKDQSVTLTAQVEDLNKQVAQLTEARKDLVSDTTNYGIEYRKIMGMNKELNALYEKVIDQNKTLLTNSTNESQKYQGQLADKEKELNEKEKTLNELQASINQQKSELDQLKKDLDAKDAKVNELQSALAKNDSLMNALKNKISDALTGFEDAGDLKVYTKNGKVYVSLSEKLLFKSGSTVVDPKGKEALKKLSDVLNKNPDIRILVEGHTDNVPLSGSGTMKDNWDLSVLRATSVARILMSDGKVDAARVTASGRADTEPVASNDSAEGRAKNRRTEIILQPNLSEITNILGTK